MRAFLIAMAVALAGCADHKSTPNYTRTDGAAVDPAKVQVVLAQCKGEAATGAGSSDPGIIPYYGEIAQQRKETTLLDACMARNGYIQAQQ
jgi:hypothetical protein